MPEIRALTLHQPWASLIAWGVKRYETRPRPLSYRGPLAIHAAKVWTQEQADAHLQFGGALFVDHYGFARWLEQPPLGCVVAVADLVDCQRMVAPCTCDEDPQICQNPESSTASPTGLESCGSCTEDLEPGEISVASVSEAERLCGYWHPGRWAYRLENVRRLAEPIPARGKQGLWRFDLPEGVL